jgi:hypothetical protein
MEVQELNELLYKGSCRPQECFDIVVSRTFHPERLRSPRLIQGHEEIFPVPKWNDFVLRAVDLSRREKTKIQ